MGTSVIAESLTRITNLENIRCVYIYTLENIIHRSVYPVYFVCSRVLLTFVFI